MVKREMVWTETPSRKTVACSACSWLTPVLGQDVSWIEEEFASHVCSDHQQPHRVDEALTQG